MSQQSTRRMADSDEPARADDELDGLRAKYEAVTGKRPFVGWSAKVLQFELTKAEAAVAKGDERDAWIWYRKAKWFEQDLFLLGAITQTVVDFAEWMLWGAGWVPIIVLLIKSWDRPFSSITVGDFLTFGFVCIFWGLIGFKLRSDRERRSRSYLDGRVYYESLVWWGMSTFAIVVIALIAGGLFSLYG